MKKSSDVPPAKTTRLAAAARHRTPGPLSPTTASTSTSSKGTRKRRRQRSASASEDEAERQEVKRARFNKDSSEEESSSDNQTKGPEKKKRKNAKKKEKKLLDKDKSAMQGDDASEGGTDYELRDQEGEEHPFPPPSQAMDDIRDQLPASSLPLHEASVEASMIPPTAGDVILSAPEDFSQVSAEALQDFNDRWKEVAGQKESILHYMEGRGSKSGLNSYHEKAFHGKVCIDWLHENTFAIQGVVNNRATTQSHAKSILKSIKAFGHQGHKHPIIAIIRKSELPDGILWDDTSAPPLSFLNRTMVGIIAGTHRLVALRLYCEEADKIIEAAEQYILILDHELQNPTLRPTTKPELQAKRKGLKETIRQLKEDRSSVAHWPTLVYDWDLILAQSDDAKDIRDELSKNFTLTYRDANAFERLAQLWRLCKKHGKDGTNILKPGPEKILWKCTETWRPLLGRVAQFPALQSEIGGQIAKYGAFASASHWPGAAAFVLLHSLSGLEALFEPVSGLPDQLDLPAEYWKQLLTPSLVKELGDCLKKHGEDLMQAGDINKWKRKHAESYWAAVEEALKTHFPRVEGRNATNSTQAMFRNALALVMEERLKAVKQDLILPLYTKELRQSVLAWFHLAAPGFYAIADMIDTNWMTFSSKADMYAYSDAGGHIVRCLLARATVEYEDGTQVVNTLDSKLTRYIIRALYEPCWVSLSAWLVGRGFSDALNGVMRVQVANEGVNTTHEDAAVMATLKALKQITGPPPKTKAPGNANNVVAQVVKDARFASQKDQKTIKDVLDWWNQWTRLGHIDPRKDWPAPMNTDVIQRMAVSYHRTTSFPAIWERISHRPEFTTIFCIFRDVPEHRTISEELLGWAVELPWDVDDQEELARRQFDLTSNVVKVHRSICLRGYDPLEPKVKGRRGGQQKVITSVDKLPDSTTLLTTDPFGIGIPVAPNMTFWAYMNTYYFIPKMWPTYTSWPELQAAMEAWQKHDLEVLELIFETTPEVFSSKQKAEIFWHQLTLGWQGLALWCMAQFTAEDGMRSNLFPLPDMETGFTSIITLLLLVDEYISVGTLSDTGNPITLPPHFKSSEIVQRLSDSLHNDLKMAPREYCTLDEGAFKALGKAWQFVNLMRPPIKARQRHHAVLFYVFAAGEQRMWPEPPDIQSLLVFYDDPDYAEAVNLPTIHDTFKALWALLYPPQPDEDLSEDDEVQGNTPSIFGGSQQAQGDEEQSNAGADYREDLRSSPDNDMQDANPPVVSRPANPPAVSRPGNIDTVLPSLQRMEIDGPAHPVTLVFGMSFLIHPKSP